MFKYFISYAHSTGVGNCSIEREGLITSQDTIREIQDCIRINENIKDVIILSFRTFE